MSLHFSVVSRSVEEAIDETNIDRSYGAVSGARAWYRLLVRLERGFVGLTLRWVSKVSNHPMLRSAIADTERKLTQALEQGIA